mgnify:CR=1 FL=1
MKNWIKETKLSAKQQLEKFFNKIYGMIDKFRNWYDEWDPFGKKREREFYKLLFRPSVEKLIFMNLLHFHYVVENGWSEEEFQRRVKFRPNTDLILVDGNANYPKSVINDYDIVMGYNQSDEGKKRFEYLLDNI